MFLKDELRPNALLMEYVPNRREFGLSDSCLHRLKSILGDVHGGHGRCLMICTR